MDPTQIESITRRLAAEVRQNFNIDTHPKYGMHLLYALWQAKLCGYNKITALEFGVAHGTGLKALESYAKIFGAEYDIQVEVFGFDTGAGLPSPRDYRDHPEIWQAGEFRGMLGQNNIIYGDVANTIDQFVNNWGDSKLAFVSLDLDFYSSTTSALKIFQMPPDRYVPAVMTHLDDTNTQLTMNPWCGAELAVIEFNQHNQFRKFEQKHRCWNLHNLYVLHVLDHPVRNGTQQTLYPLNCSPL
jgi:hypothetical protein